MAFPNDGAAPLSAFDRSKNVLDAIKRGDFKSPEAYGAVGDGIADDTQALRRMLAAPGERVYAPRPGATYHITGQLDFGRSSEWLRPLRLKVSGSRTAPGSDLGVQTGGGSQHLAVVFAQGDHSGPSIEVTVEVAAVNPWLAILSNDFYLHADGSRPDYQTRFAFDKVKLSADKYVQGYSGDGNAAIRMQGMDELSISRIFVTNFERAYIHADVTHAEVGSRLARLDNFRSGLQVTRSLTVATGNVFAYGSVANKNYSPGSNALVVRAIENFSCGNVMSRDAGEHGVRITSMYAEAGGVGLLGRDVLTSASFGNVKVERPGGCGFKADSGSASPETRAPILSVIMGNLDVIDAGTQDYGTGGTFTGQNHFGLNLQIVRSFVCSSFTSRREISAYNGRHNLLMRNVSNIVIGHMNCGGAYSDAVFWNNEEENNYNVRIGGGSVFDYGADGFGRALHILNGGRVGRVAIDLDMSNGPAGVRLAGDYVGTPLNFWRISGTHFNVSGELLSGSVAARVRVNLTSASPNTSSTQDSYSTGTQLLCRGEAGANSIVRSALADVYLDSSASRSFVAVAAGGVPATPVGDKLSGVWRGRGQSGDGLVAFVEKVSP